MYNNDNIYRKVGEFWTHFQFDMDKITAALTEAGYGVCKTLQGDMIIMAPGDYSEEDFEEFTEDDDDDDDGDTFNFKKEY